MASCLGETICPQGPNDRCRAEPQGCTGEHRGGNLPAGSRHDAQGRDLLARRRGAVDPRDLVPGDLAHAEYVEPGARAPRQQGAGQ